MSTCRGCDGTGHVSPRYAFAGICTRCWGTGNEPAPKTENHENGRSTLPQRSEEQWVTAPDGEEFRVGQCQGHAECPVKTHEHGCYADVGNCDHPEDHKPGDPS